MSLRAFLVLTLLVGLRCALPAQPFAVDTSPSPIKHPALAPADGAIATTNPPSLIWRHDETAASYTVEFSPAADFSRGVIRTENIPASFYNHNATLAPGTWYWRYFVVRANGAVSLPGPMRSFRVTADSVPLPIPSAAELLAALPGHPRVFTRPETLAEFRARRLGAGRDAWANIRAKADALLALTPTLPPMDPLPAKFASHRQQIFHVVNGVAQVPRAYRVGELLRDAERANLLSLAWLISGDERYAKAARDWALFAAAFRVDYHLPNVTERGQHDTVVYSYEKGVTAIAYTYDRLVGMLNAADRRALLDHVEFHGEASLHWIRDVMRIHLEFQDSHGQQCMHALLSTALAIAGDSAKANEWLAYLVPQYANRIAWTGDDGGYFEGQGYAFKFNYILETLAGLRTATGIDLFRKPAIHNAGAFWLYCMSLNYWWPHGGDNMPLVNPFGNAADAYISALLASATDSRPLRWWSDAVPADPSHVPFSYLSATGLRPQPPVAVAQARAFHETGQLSAFARLYDHGAPRIFFRSSPWGGSSHAQADQNSFVLHAGGEILASDVGYYSYFGDENYNRISAHTIAHNSVLVNGQGQINEIEGKGAITAFFNSPDYVFFAGDASQAYGPPVDRFHRDVLYLRPDLFVMADELHAPTPSTWSWVFNTFTKPALDATAREFVVTQREQNLWAKQVFPEGLQYTNDNTRKYPMLTRRWARYTEAFPEPWRLQATTEKTNATEFLSVLHTYSNAQGRRAQLAQSLQNATTSAVTLETSGGKETVLLRRHHDNVGALEAWGLNCDGRAFAGLRDKTGNFTRWTAIAARTASADGRALLRATQPVDLALSVGTAAAAAQLWTQASAPTTVTLALPARPAKILAFAPNQFAAGESVSFRWADGQLELAVPEGTRTFWIDPTVAPSALPARLTVALQDAAGSLSLECETAIAENGDWVAYAKVTPRTTGIYEVTSSAAATEILLQDHWDPERTTRGQGRAQGLICGGTEVILRFPPSATPPTFTARLVQPRAANEINLIRNGNCEAGLPDYPPRGWTVRHSAMGEFATDGKQGWPGWTTEDAASGKAALKFTRPLNRMTDWKAPYPETARDTLAVAVPPVRLLTAGRYVLSLKTKGTATAAVVQLVAATAAVQEIKLKPSASWTDNRLETELPPGFTEVKIIFRAGGANDQVLWVDDVCLTAAGP